VGRRRGRRVDHDLRQRRSRAGTRWQKEPRSAAGYTVRHPKGL
jgi:hypothetical protein